MKIKFETIKIYTLLFIVHFSWSQQNIKNLANEEWYFKNAKDSIKYKASIPGTIHTDLLANALIPDPFLETNEKKVQWVENEDWIYETDFYLSKKEKQFKNIDLECFGLDTYAILYVNGKEISKTNNQFRKWTFSVQEYLKEGKNKIAIYFQSAVKNGKKESEKLKYTLPGEEKIFTRKAQYQYGWDWGPRLVTCGIIDTIQLKFWNKSIIENLQYDQKQLEDSFAEIEWIADIICEEEGTYHFQWNENTFIKQLTKGENKINWTDTIHQPKKWWCNGLGEPNLYGFGLTLSQNGDILDKKELKIGLRTIELVQEKDAIGSSFYFKINGIPVFMKGANYIPPDSFISRVTDSIYQSIVINAKKANMNMLRVWGGGVYASDSFYKACDENGILVWQDFMFACAMYPGDNSFLENVKLEVIDQVNRLQHHPSIALWCGNNEINEGWHNWGWQKQYNYTKEEENIIWNDYEKLFHEIIPNAIKETVANKQTIYWPSSPSIGWGKKESLYQGDSHYWGVWWGKEPFEIYEKKVGRFMSEYGFQGMPALSTITSFTDKLSWKNEAIKTHQKHPVGYETIKEYMERDYHVPKDFDNYLYVSQLLQARGMQIAIEAHRRAKPYCMGTLYWQLNDCWPVTSWSSTDYYGNWKAFHYQVKRSYESLLLSVCKENEKYVIYGINDEVETKKGNLKIQLIDFDGTILWHKEEYITIKENQNKIITVLDDSLLQKVNQEKVVLSVKLETDKEKITSNYYFVKPKKLKLKKPTIIIKRQNETTIEITTNTLAKDVFLFSEGVHFEENYFDLLPHEKRIIHLSSPTENIIVKSLFDTLKN